MVGALCLPQACILLGQGLLEAAKLLLHGRLPLVQNANLLRHRAKGLLKPFYGLLSRGLVGLGPQQTGIQLCPSDIDLLHHSIQPAQLGLDGSPLVQLSDNGILADLYPVIQLRYLLLKLLQTLSCSLCSRSDFLHLSIRLPLVQKQSLFVLLLGGDFLLKSAATVI